MKLEIIQTGLILQNIIADGPGTTYDICYRLWSKRDQVIDPDTVYGICNTLVKENVLKSYTINDEVPVYFQINVDEVLEKEIDNFQEKENEKDY